MHIGKLSTLKDQVEAAIKTVNEDANGWRDISDAKKDGETIIWAVFRNDIAEQEKRPDLERWHGVQVPLTHPGVDDDGFGIGWTLAAPIGQGSFPDEWIAGWRPMPSYRAPEAESLVSVAAE